MPTDRPELDHPSSGEASKDAARRQDVTPPASNWTDRGDMVSNNGSANQMFRRNSEQLQKSAQARREDTVPGDPRSKSTEEPSGNRHDHATLKNEQANATKSAAGIEAVRDPGGSDRPLSFAKDHERGARADLKVEAAQGTGLTFVKDQGQNINRGR